MKEENRTTTLFIDIGGVLLSDGWDRNSRNAASKLFKLNHLQMEERHHVNFETFEIGKMSLDVYLDRVVFYQPREFSKDQFKSFMFEQSLPFQKMILLFNHLKKKYNLKVATISNEASELNEYRIKKFRLNEFIDFFISSSIVNLRKPDTSIFSLALAIAQVNASESIYIDDQPMFVSIAEEFGMKGIVHTDYDSTLEALAKFGLVI